MIIREFIKATLQERIRSNTFQFNKFKSLIPGQGGNMDAFVTYAEKHLEKLGEGSSRKVFLLGSQKVLKVATNAFGTRQNREEVMTSQDPKTHSIIAKVREYDKNGYVWLVADLVKEFQTEKELKQELGINTRSYFADLIEDIFGNAKIDKLMLDYSIDKNNEKLKEFIITLQNLINSYKMKQGDLERSDHFGMSRDSLVVLLDYGFNDNTNTRYR